MIQLQNLAGVAVITTVLGISGCGRSADVDGGDTTSGAQTQQDNTNTTGGDDTGGNTGSGDTGGNTGGGDTGGNTGGGDTGGNTGGGDTGGNTGGGDTGGNTGGGDTGGGTTDPETRHRYSMFNQCFALRSEANGNFVVRSGSSFMASASAETSAEGFFMKPSNLGSYLLYDQDRKILIDSGSITNATLDAADQSAIWVAVGVGDTTNYPTRLQFNVEPTAAEIAAVRNFQDPLVATASFNLINAATGNNLAVDGSGALTSAAASTATAQQFRFVKLADDACMAFPEASSNTVGTSFSGTTADGRVLGMADTHVHISSTTFLGQAQWGSPFHEFGVTHALDDCVEYHGENGERDAVGGLFENNFTGHDVTGWPTFPQWPARNELLHEAIYWKWVERAWLGGLRVIVNDLVDNETLCELQRNVSGDPTIDCNSMNNAGRQAGSMYAMQDYIDAQYGGPGQGFYRITHSSAEARTQIEAGNAAVVLGIEISNLLNCQVNYSPSRTEEPFQESGSGGTENSYSCTEDSIVEQLDRVWGWGVRQIITIHEFDNAFGGNGIFDGLVLNAGNREDSGGIPGGTLSNPLAVMDVDPTDPFSQELPTGEFWTTYDCPEENDDPANPFSGYLFSNAGGTNLQSLQPNCVFQGQGGRPGGSTPCYPDKRQCNARWLTPLGLFTYTKIMEKGFIFDVDHLEMEMKSQALELAEAQNPPYPFVSTHGTFGGTSIDQAQRMIRNGGHIYPSLGNGPAHLNKMAEMRQVHANSGTGHLFGFGFGTDTNGLSGQAGPRNAGQVEAAGAIAYPYTLFQGGLFAQLDDFNGNNTLDGNPIAGVVFQQPEVRDPSIDDPLLSGRTWHLDADGSAHYGMMSGMVQEVNLHGTAQDMQDLFNAAEVFLRTWRFTELSNAGILNNDNGGQTVVPPGVLRAAPLPSSIGRGF